MTRLNVGAGRNPLPGWTNLDIRPGPGIDLVADIQTDKITGGWYDEIRMVHVLEHLTRPLDAMQHLWDVASPDATLTVVCPHGASDDAWEDQTHLRPYYPTSFLAFSQPYYHLADYGYQADWQITQCVLTVYRQFEDNLEYALRHFRNVARNMLITMRAVRPARPVTAQQEFPKLQVRWIDG